MSIGILRSLTISASSISILRDISTGNHLISIFEQWCHPLIAIIDKRFHRLVLFYNSTNPTAKSTLTTRRLSLISDYSRALVVICRSICVNLEKLFIVITPRRWLVVKYIPHLFQIQILNRWICVCIRIQRMFSQSLSFNLVTANRLRSGRTLCQSCANKHDSLTHGINFIKNELGGRLNL